MEVHPLAGAYRQMTETEFAEMVASVKRHGVKVACWKYEGKVLDGRHRLRAAEAAGVPVEKWETFEGTEDEARELVKLLNGVRRHDTIEDRREAVHRLRGLGLSVRVIAEQVGVSFKTVHRDLGSGVSDDTPEPTDDKDEVTDELPEVTAEEAEPEDRERPAPPASPSPAEEKKVKGKDGKSYPAKKATKKRKPAVKPPPAANVDAAWSEFKSKLAAVVDSALALSPKCLPEGVQKWEICKLLQEASRKMMGAATRFAPSR